MPLYILQSIWEESIFFKNTTVQGKALAQIVGWEKKH